ncbi:MAG: hypothetical protein HC877_02995 [Thioploca sp.]|nr:hypothetical protein [Thioploca sp.]
MQSVAANTLGNQNQLITGIKQKRNKNRSKNDLVIKDWLVITASFSLLNKENNFLQLYAVESDG